MPSFHVVGFVILVLLFGSPLLAQESEEQLEDLSQTAANPIADLMSFPFQNNTDFGLGPYDRTLNVLNVQPVIPFAGGRFVTRTIIPFTWIPDVTAPSGSFSSGLADILFTGFYVPPSGSVMWGVGPVIEFPTGGEERGSQKWSLGVSGLVLAQPTNWTLGLLANNV
jgi:hypothetical protein